MWAETWTKREAEPRCILQGKPSRQRESERQTFGYEKNSACSGTSKGSGSFCVRHTWHLCMIVCLRHPSWFAATLPCLSLSPAPPFFVTRFPGFLQFTGQYPFNISCKIITGHFFSACAPCVPPPTFLRVLFSVLNFVTYYSYIKNLPKWTFKTCASISGCGSPVLQLLRPKTSSRPDCLFSLSLNIYCISRLLSAQSSKHGRVQPPLPSPLQPKAPPSLAWITLTAYILVSLLLSPSSLSST